MEKPQKKKRTVTQLQAAAAVVLLAVFLLLILFFPQLYNAVCETYRTLSEQPALFDPQQISETMNRVVQFISETG